MREYVKRKLYESKLNKKIFNTNVSIKDDLPDGFDLNKVILKIEELVPYYCFSNVDKVYIGDFPELTDRSMNAAFAENVIYVTNHQESESDMVDDVVHELAHAVEEANSGDIYSDGLIEREFMSKRKMLFSDLESEGYEVPDEFLHNSNFVQEVDDFLFMEVGYPTLEAMTSDYFLLPYSITSIREYWATGFEFYFYGKYDIVKTLCPNVYKKIKEVLG